MNKSSIIYRSTVAFALLIAVSGCGGGVGGEPTLQFTGQAVPYGVYGGEDITAQVGSTTSTIVFSCSTATINGPITTDAQGNFTARGTVAPSGPTSPTALPPAIVVGSVNGDSMTLDIKQADTGVELGHYALVRGQVGTVLVGGCAR